MGSYGSRRAISKINYVSGKGCKLSVEARDGEGGRLRKEAGPPEPLQVASLLPTLLQPIVARATLLLFRAASVGTPSEVGLAEIVSPRGPQAGLLVWEPLLRSGAELLPMAEAAQPARPEPLREMQRGDLRLLLPDQTQAAPLLPTTPRGAGRLLPGEKHAVLRYGSTAQPVQPIARVRGRAGAHGGALAGGTQMVELALRGKVRGEAMVAGEMRRSEETVETIQGELPPGVGTARRELREGTRERRKATASVARGTGEALLGASRVQQEGDTAGHSHEERCFAQGYSSHLALRASLC